MSLRVLRFYANRRWNLEDNVASPMGAKRKGSAEPIPEAMPEPSELFYDWGDTWSGPWGGDHGISFGINQEFQFDDEKIPQSIGSRPHLVHDNVKTSTNIIDASWVDDINLDINLGERLQSYANAALIVILFRSPVPMIPMWLIQTLETYGPKEKFTAQ